MAKGDNIKKLLEKVPEAKRASVQSALEGVDGLIDEIDSGYMRQDDYSRSMNEAKEAQKEWETEKAVMEENYAKAKKNYDDMYADWTKTSTEKKAATEALEKAQKELKEHQDKQNIDPEKYLSKDDYKAEMAKFATGQSIYFSETLDAAYEIEQVTGQRVNPSHIYNESVKAKQSPKEYAEKAFDLAKKREEKATNAQKQRDDAAEKRGYDKRVAEETNPATKQLLASDHPFYASTDEKAKQPWEQTETPADEAKFLQELTSGRPAA